MIIADLLRQAASELGDMREARILMAAALGVEPARLTLLAHDPIDDEAQALFLRHVKKRMSGAPMSHITGQRLFWGRSFAVTADVLDPRPETETLIAAALEVPFARLLDLGTGSGCIAITLLAENTQASGLAVDKSDAAIKVATANAEALGIGERLVLRQSDWFSLVSDHFDLIVSNPPYIPAADMDALMPEVRDHEPHMALTDGADGLGAYRVILEQGQKFLTSGGWLMAEFGVGQWPDIEAIARAFGWQNIHCRMDMDDRPRVLVAQNPQ